MTLIDGGDDGGGGGGGTKQSVISKETEMAEMVPNLHSTEITTTLISSIAKIPKVAILHKRWVKKSKATRTSTNGVNNLTAPYLHVQDSRGAGASDVSRYIAECPETRTPDWIRQINRLCV